jgi:hypothetical protein
MEVHIMLDKIFKKINYKLAIIIIASISLAFYLIGAIGEMVNGSFDGTLFIWLIIDALLFGGLIVSKILDKKELGVGCTYVLIGFNVINWSLANWGMLGTIDTLFKNNWISGISSLLWILAALTTLVVLIAIITRLFVQHKIFEWIIDVGLVIFSSIMVFCSLCVFLSPIANSNVCMPWTTGFAYLMYSSLSVLVMFAHHENKLYLNK